MESFSTVGKQVAITGIAGGCVGFVYASCVGKRILPTMLYMCSNWTVPAVPLFTIRQSILEYRQWNSEENGFKAKDRNDMIASVVSGTFLGFGAGYLWGGPWAILPAGIVHAFLGATTQLFFTKFRYWRLEKSLEYAEPAAVSKRWNVDVFRADATPYDRREDNTFDPAKYLFNGIRNLFFGLFGEEPPSCIRYAADIDYRKKLNLKIGILKQQIYDLQVELHEKGIDFEPK
jgi:hypothetical protein